MFHSEKLRKCFRSTLRRRYLKTQQSPVILDLWLRKTWSGKSHEYRDVIVFEKLRFSVHTKMQSRCFQSSSSLKSVSEKLRFRGGLVWTEDLTEEVKRRFYISPA